MQTDIQNVANDFFKTFSFRGLIGTLTITFSFVFLFLLMFKSIPKGNETIVNVSVGFIIGVGVAAVVSYYFGASKDKSDSDKATNVATLLEANKPTTTD